MRIDAVKLVQIFFLQMRWRLVLACLLVGACSPAPAPFHGTDLTGASFARHLELSDHHGQRRTLADFRGKVVVVFFGYTSCPDICPTTLSRLAAVMQSMGPDAARVQVLFVSLDPERDSLERLAQFVPWFHPGFLALRGDTEETRRVLTEFRVFSARKDVAGGMGYVLDHSSGAYVYDPAGRLRLYARDTASVDELVSDFRRLLAGE